MKRTLVIAHEPDSGAAQIEVRLRERGFAVDTHVVTPDPDRSNVAEQWPDLAPYDIVVPMGSVRNLPNRSEIDTWVVDELELLRAAHERGQPVLGVCFGGQLMAEALGGIVETAPVTELGWYELQCRSGPDSPIDGGPWLEWHHDRFVPPDSAEILAETDDAIQLFRMGRTVGTQFHPEVDLAHVSAWLSGTSDAYLAAYGMTRERMLSEMAEHEERNTKACHAFVDWFVDEVAVAEAPPE